jgi:hypothetical protein
VPRTAQQAAPVVAGTHAAVDPVIRAAVLAHDLVASAKSRHGDRQLEIAAAAFINHHGVHDREIALGARATIRLLIRANQSVPRPAVGLALFDRMGNLIFSAGTPQLNFPMPALVAGQEVLLDFRLGFDVQPGEYTLGLDAGELGPDGPNTGFFHDRITGLGPVAVTHDPQAPFPFFGAARLPLEICHA